MSYGVRLGVPQTDVTTATEPPVTATQSSASDSQNTALHGTHLPPALTFAQGARAAAVAFFDIVPPWFKLTALLAAGFALADRFLDLD